MKLNRDQIIKALECCSKDDCDNCPNSFGNCYSNLARDALSLIKELTEENERLRADTIDEFVKMVKEKMREVATGKRASLVGIGWLDQIAKELKGEG